MKHGEVTWSHFCDAMTAHVINPKTIKDRKAGGKKGRTFCRQETTDRIDRWTNEEHYDYICGICWRALAKADGVKIKRKHRRSDVQIVSL